MENTESLKNLSNQENLYEDSFDINSLSEEQKNDAKKHLLISTFPAGVGILLHFLTGSIFTFIYCGILHDKFKRIKHDDFGSGKAIGFRFIPFFNLYWIFMLYVRLSKRINFQYRLRDEHPPVSTGLTITYCILRLIPYVNYAALLIFLPIVYGQIQIACNKLILYDLKMKNQ